MGWHLSGRFVLSSRGCPGLRCVRVSPFAPACRGRQSDLASPPLAVGLGSRLPSLRKVGSVGGRWSGFRMSLRPPPFEFGRSATSEVSLLGPSHPSRWGPSDSSLVRGRGRVLFRCRLRWLVPGSIDSRAFIHRRVCSVRPPLLALEHPVLPWVSFPSKVLPSPSGSGSGSVSGCRARSFPLLLSLIPRLFDPGCGIPFALPRWPPCESVRSGSRVAVAPGASAWLSPCLRVEVSLRR